MALQSRNIRWAWGFHNNRMVTVSKAKGYHYQYLYCLNAGHVPAMRGRKSCLMRWSGFGKAIPSPRRRDLRSSNSSGDAERRGLARNLQSGNRDKSLRVCFAFALGGAESPFERIAWLELKILKAA
jgi:hypothetical protein